MIALKQAPARWVGFLLLSALIGAYLTFRIRDEDRSVYLPGKTTHGHYQIEMACENCHTPMGGVRSEACLDCHDEELSAADDSHPPSKFLDPRNASLLKRLDARECITCHTEHRPELTDRFGVTLPADYCVHCHERVGEERPSHEGLSHDTCGSAGCHNFHDNRALHEDYLTEHLSEPALLATAVRTFSTPLPAKSRPLSSGDEVAPSELRKPGAVAEWAASSHARAGVNCMDCHRGGGSELFKVSETACNACHEQQVSGMHKGHHGMRLAEGLSAMRPGLARKPMKPDAGERELSCNSCHGAHEYDLTRAAVDACVSCHDDEHTRAYEASPHGRLFRAEMRAAAVASESAQKLRGSGVSCATCHMPAVPTSPGSPERFVQHNQNDNLQPNDKMVRTVCTSCHGASFAFDALADSKLVQRNFAGRPSVHVESIDWVARRKAAQEQSVKAADVAGGKE